MGRGPPPAHPGGPVIETCFRECVEATMRERDDEVLREMRGRGWLRPLDVGGADGSHHSRTLARLVKRGQIERRQRGALGSSRPSYVYRLVTPAAP